MGDKPDSMADISEDRASSKKVGILRALIPFFSPYKLLVFVALTALFITATVSLALPVAARRVIDGFAQGDTTLLNKYFLAAVGMAAIFALGTGLRYYMVTRLGERVVELLIHHGLIKTITDLYAFPSISDTPSPYFHDSEEAEAFFISG